MSDTTRPTRWYEEPLEEIRSHDREHFYYGETLIDIPMLRWNINHVESDYHGHQMGIWFSDLAAVAREVYDSKTVTVEQQKRVRGAIHYLDTLGMTLR